MASFHRCAAVVILTLLSGVLTSAETRWIRMTSGDFEIFSSAGMGDTRRTLEYFRRVAEFFEKATGRKVKHDELVRVVLFSSPKEYLPYRPNEFAAAFYTQTGGRDYIVLGGAGIEVFPVAIHEYTHLVVRHAGLEFPPWLNEGYAEVFSTIEPFGDKIRIGQVIPGRFLALNGEKWEPLQAILTADHNSPYYNEKQKAGNLYNEGWALVHMLMLSKDYEPLFAKFLEELARTKNSVEALESVYGKPLPQIEKDLQAYVRRMSSEVRVRIYDQKLAKLADKPDGEPAASADVKLALLEISNRAGQGGRGMDPDTIKQLQEIAADNPKRPDPWVTLGYMQARSDKMPDALQSFAKALELGGKNPQMLWDYARMAAGTDTPHAMQSLQRLMEQQPERLEVRLMLAQLQVSSRLTKEAVETLAVVKKVTPDDAPRLFKILAFAKQDADPPGARKNGESWRDNAKETGDKLEAERFLSFLDSRERSEKEKAKEQAERKANPRPQLVAETAASINEPAPLNLTAAPVGPAAQHLTVTGKFVDFNCTDSKRLRFILQLKNEQTEDSRIVLLMDDPQKVIMHGLNGATRDMNCGAQKPVTTLKMDYEPLPSTEPNLRGMLRAIYFNLDATNEPAAQKQLKQRP